MNTIVALLTILDKGWTQTEPNSEQIVSMLS